VIFYFFDEFFYYYSNKKIMSTSDRKDLFLKTLWDILNEQSVTIKTQLPRFQHLWSQYWNLPGVEFPEVRRVVLDRDRFLTDLPYRLECVRTLENAMTDAYFVIKAIITMLFRDYIDSGKIMEDFDPEDVRSVSFLIADQLVGSLLQFVSMEPMLIPIGFIVVAKNKAMMKLKGRTLSQIIDDLANNHLPANPEEIQGILQQMVEWGYLKIEYDAEKQVERYLFIKDYTLSPSGTQKYTQKIKSIVEWAVELWRSLYNIRSIDTVIPEDYPFRDFLVETVKRAATQGYLTAHNVIENIGNYYQHCLEQGQLPP
jgi:hypothetical protein